MSGEAGREVAVADPWRGAWRTGAVPPSAARAASLAGPRVISPCDHLGAPANYHGGSDGDSKCCSEQDGAGDGEGEAPTARPRARRKDQRIEEATALTLVALEGLADAQAAREAATARVGDAVRTLLAEDVTAERAAALLDVDVTEVRRLSKAASAEAPTPARMSGRAERKSAPAEPKATVTALPEQDGSEDAARRAG